VLIADDHPIASEGIAAVLLPCATVVGRVETLEQLRSVVPRLRPDVVVLDLTFDGELSIPAMKELLEQGSTSRFVILTAHQSPALARTSLAAGAHGFVLKGGSIHDLRLAIAAAMEDRQFCSTTIGLLDPSRSDAVQARREVVIGGVAFTRRQVECVAHLHDGMDRERAAEAVGISAKGIEYHVAEVKLRLGMTRTLDLMRWCDEHIAGIRRGLESDRDQGFA